jgi:hypothetical protein
MNDRGETRIRRPVWPFLRLSTSVGRSRQAQPSPVRPSRRRGADGLLCFHGGKEVRGERCQTLVPEKPLADTRKAPKITKNWQG